MGPPRLSSQACQFTDAPLQVKRRKPPSGTPNHRSTSRKRYCRSNGENRHQDQRLRVNLSQRCCRSNGESRFARSASGQIDLPAQIGESRGCAGHSSRPCPVAVPGPRHRTSRRHQPGQPLPQLRPAVGLGEGAGHALCYPRQRVARSVSAQPLFQAVASSSAALAPTARTAKRSLSMRSRMP